VVRLKEMEWAKEVFFVSSKQEALELTRSVYVEKKSLQVPYDMAEI
jgi:hypothetical protein